MPADVHIVWFGHSLVGVYSNREAADAVAKARDDYNRQRWGDRAGVLQASVTTHPVQDVPKPEDL